MPNALYLGKKIPIAGVAHQNGTVRFGTDPATSALDADCKAHELDNLYVVDGSFFVSSSAVNPGLTIMANALRVAERIGFATRLGRHAEVKRTYVAIATLFLALTGVSAPRVAGAAANSPAYPMSALRSPT